MPSGLALALLMFLYSTFEIARRAHVVSSIGLAGQDIDVPHINVYTPLPKRAKYADWKFGPGWPAIRSPEVAGWRRGWDSNPRLSFPNTRFPSVLLKPLGHLSVPWSENSV